jgi:hypothetical protein
MKKELKKQTTLKRRLTRGIYKAGKKVKSFASDKFVSGVANIAYSKDYSLVKPSKIRELHLLRSFKLL